MATGDEEARATELLGLHTEVEKFDHYGGDGDDEVVDGYEVDYNGAEYGDAGDVDRPIGNISEEFRHDEFGALQPELQSHEEIDLELVKLREMVDGSQTHEGGCSGSAPYGVGSVSDRRRSASAEVGGTSASCEEGEEDSDEVDRRSIYVGNVDYGATPQELQDHFKTCGAVNRITIMVDKFTGHPKGYAYVEFADPLGVSNAVILSDSVFRGREIKVCPKRKNLPGFRRGAGRGRGRGSMRGGRGGPRPYGFGPGYDTFRRGYGPRFRARGRGGWGPY